MNKSVQHIGRIHHLIALFAQQGQGVLDKSDFTAIRSSKVKNLHGHIPLPVDLMKVAELDRF
jgi:hypothetical protein